MKHALALLLFSMQGIAWADDIDQAFKAQKAPSHVRTEVDSGVQRQSAQARQKVAERAMAIERQRAEEMRRAETGPASTATGTSPRSTTPQGAEGAFTYACTYTCTNAKVLSADKTYLTVRVKASSEAAARDAAYRHGNATCYEQTQRVYETGSASCRKQ